LTELDRSGYKNTASEEPVRRSVTIVGTRGQLRRNAHFLRLGLLGNFRDLSAIQRQLYDKQLAVPLGQEFLPGGNKPADELQSVVLRIKQLLAEPGATEGD
jgi:hypothetical protein